MELDFAIVAAIAGMIAIANPNLKPLKPASSNQNRAVASTQQASEFNTAEHARYKNVRWGGAFNQPLSERKRAFVQKALNE